MVLQSLPSGLSLSASLQILVSLLVAGLYYLTLRTQRRQSKIQETQNQIMQWQTRLMAAEYEPDIRINDIDAENNVARVTISNLGQGRAKRLRLRCFLYYKRKVEYQTAFSNQVLGSVIVPKKCVLSRSGQKSKYIDGREVITPQTEYESHKESIAIQEDNVVFSADVELTIRALDPVMDVDFTSAIEHMKNEWDADEFGFDLYLSYHDVIDQELPVRVVSVKDIDTSDGVTLSDALQEGVRTEEPVSTLVDDASKPDDIQLLEQKE